MYAGTWRERGRGGHNEAKFSGGSERKSRVQEHASAREQLKTRRTRRALRNASGFKEPDTGAPSPSLRTVKKKISAQSPLPFRSPFHLIPRHQWQITPLTRVEAELLDRVLSLALHPIKAYQKHASHYSASPGSPSLSVSSIMRSCPSPCTAAVAAPPPSTRSYRWNSLQP
jgi:hypothetical protein